MEKHPVSGGDKKIVTTTCSYDCGGRCLLEIHVKNNKVNSIRSGYTGDLHLNACPRGLMQKEVLHSPRRLRSPLKRTGERGSGEFKPVSWDEALDTVAGKLKQTIRDYGTGSVYFVGGSGSLSVLNDVRMVPQRFFAMLGKCTTTWGGESLEGALQSSLATFGTQYTACTRDNMLHSKYIILWGWNPVATRFGSDTYYYLDKVKQAGTRIISIDPRRTRTARLFAHEWIPVIPGTDTAMLIAMAQVMIEEGIYDTDYIERYTHGFSDYRDYVMGAADGIEKSPRWAEPICGVPAGTIRKTARDYARAKPAAMMTGWAPGRSAYGEQFHRAASVLAAMTGNIGVKGGFVAGGADIMDLGRIEDKLPVPHMEHNLVHNTDFYDALINGRKKGYPADCRFLYLIGSNLLNQYLNLNKGIEAFKKPGFIVINELFLTPTARFADVILPVTHYLEKDDAGLPWTGGRYMIYMNKAVEPDAGTRSDLEIFTGIAKRVGLKEYNDKPDEEWLDNILAGSPGFPGLEHLKSRAVHRFDGQYPRVAFTEQISDPVNNPFPTPTGKIEIYSRRFADLKDPLIPPIPKYIPAWEGRDDAKRKDYPLQLITPHSARRINSQLDNIKKMKKDDGDFIWLNPRDARNRDIRDGDAVVVFNSRGCLRTRARVTGSIMEGVASLDTGQWYDPDAGGTDNGGNANVLTLDRMSPAGAFTSNTCLVQVEKI